MAIAASIYSRQRDLVEDRNTLKMQKPKVQSKKSDLRGLDLRVGTEAGRGKDWEERRGGTEAGM